MTQEEISPKKLKIRLKVLATLSYINMVGWIMLLIYIYYKNGM